LGDRYLAEYLPAGILSIHRVKMVNALQEYPLASLFLIAVTGGLITPILFLKWVQVELPGYEYHPL
jgi:hypothetical protein